MSNPIADLTKKEWRIWIGSMVVIVILNFLSEKFDLLTLVASCIGVTSLIFAAKGNVWSQILMIIFSILYGIISWRFRYWGEMMTYLGMTMPMAVWSTITWIRNPSKNGKKVEIQRLTKKHIYLLLISGIIVTALLYIILTALKTPNIIFFMIYMVLSAGRKEKLVCNLYY